MKVVKTRRYKTGYETRWEEIAPGESGSDKPLVIRAAYTPEGHYIGDPKMAYFLVVKKGIKPEPMQPENPDANGGRGRTCCIGFCENEQKWYGWSHRAICGFGVGHVVEKGDCAASSGWTDDYLRDHPEAELSVPVGFEARSLADCRRLAVAFADSVR